MSETVGYHLRRRIRTNCINRINATKIKWPEDTNACWFTGHGNDFGYCEL